MKKKQSSAQKDKADNAPKGQSMRRIKIERLVLSAGATADALAKSKKLLEFLTNRKPQVIASQKRIPDFGVSPDLEVGARVTLRGAAAIDILKRLLGAIDNTLKKKQVAENHLSFGIEEYIEIPGVEYQRDIGIRGFNVTIVFARAGVRVKRKKIKQGRLPRRQHIPALEIMNFMEEQFKTAFT